MSEVKLYRLTMRSLPPKGNGSRRLENVIDESLTFSRLQIEQYRLPWLAVQDSRTKIIPYFCSGDEK
jgi:hypothetical protein